MAGAEERERFLRLQVRPGRSGLEKTPWKEKKMNNRYKSIDEYIQSFPAEVRTILENIRQIIRRAAPHAQETISYQMPAFKLNGILVYFAAFKKHIGFFPTASGVAAFKKDLEGYKSSKGTIQFPLEKPIPYALIEKIVDYRVRENLAKKAAARGRQFS
jgi:uncharacterized protein YdhG (YjbR/CyaY superfamily)